ncbi:MAG: hypothetical protein IIT65_15960, partial [Lachnospiraceae bacterium]|nr:hypothetical protein [Lachnospiraceae bacterium]
VAVQTYDSIFSQIKTYLSFLDAPNYFNDYESESKYHVEVSIKNIKLGLTRVKIKGNNTNFYYLPTITVYGQYIVLDSANVVILDSTQLYDEEGKILLVVNAIDNSIINISNGY